MWAVVKQWVGKMAGDWLANKAVQSDGGPMAMEHTTPGERAQCVKALELWPVGLAWYCGNRPGPVLWKWAALFWRPAR
jgi:hypothetical protein